MQPIRFIGPVQELFVVHRGASLQKPAQKQKETTTTNH
jgi:hypothetical protein